MGDSSTKFSVAICGASGTVGQELVRILEERSFPVSNLRLLASERSAGERMSFCGEDLPVEILDHCSLSGVEIAFFTAGMDVSKEYVPLAIDEGCVVIDNTNAYRMEADVPLVVPEVNPLDLNEYSNRNIIANPSCSTIQLAMILKPLDSVAPIKRVVVTSLHAVSGAGRRGVEELERQTLSVFNLKEIVWERFPRQIAFNCLPQVDGFLENGYSQEEQRILEETRKVLHRPDLRLTATAVRVPIFYGNSASVNVELSKKLSMEEFREQLSQTPSVQLLDLKDDTPYPTVLDVTGGDNVWVGRIREDPSIENGWNLWLVTDNIRKGAALNAVQIAEILADRYL